MRHSHRAKQLRACHPPDPDLPEVTTVKKFLAKVTAPAHR